MNHNAIVSGPPDSISPVCGLKTSTPLILARICLSPTGSIAMSGSPKTTNSDEDGEEYLHAADVAQCWRVDAMKPIRIPRIPAWTRRSLFGRSTYGVIPRDELCGDP
jgi:hypothetical protein